MLTVPEGEILNLLAQVAPEAGEIGPDTPLADVGFDSLAYAELAAAVLDRYGLDLVDATGARCRTAGEVVDLVLRAADREAYVRDAIPAGVGRRQALAERVAGRVIRWWFDVTIQDADRMPASG